MDSTRPAPSSAPGPAPRPAPPAAHGPSAPVFIAHDGAGTRLWVAADLDATIRTLELDSKAHFDRLLARLVPDRTRAAGRAATLALEVGSLSVHVKRALKGGWLGPLFAGRVPTWRRVGNELHVAAGLWARGAPVPRPIFAAGRLGVLGWRAVLGSELVPGALDGASALERAPATELHVLLGTFGRTIRAFHDAGGWHADLAITNLLHAPGSGRTFVVDLQGCRIGTPPPHRRRRRELARLWRSIERRPAIRASLEAGWPSLMRAYDEPARAHLLPPAGVD